MVLNVGRGSAIEQDAFIELLESGHIGGAGLDVTTPEPLPADSKLWNMPNVIITPHVSGGMSLEITLDLIVDKFIRYLGDYIAGREFIRAVDRVLEY
jgi:phosphoglycerate dehydrogenase-like enzyme